MFNEVTAANNKIRISEKIIGYRRILQQRLFIFSVKVMKYILTLPNMREYDVFRNQLSKSGTSIGANYEEAISAFGKKEFISKLSICLKEFGERNYWLRILKELDLGDCNVRNELEQESAEFIKIFTASIKTSRIKHRLPTFNIKNLKSEFSNLNSQI